MLIGKLAIIFSHPNHELAIFGLLKRLKPHLIFLTDGGGEKRIAETKNGLESVGIADQALFLNHPEASFYERLLRKDEKFFFDVSMQVRSALNDLKPESTFCDAVEFYNPVHDLTLPIVLAALGGCYDNLFEIPLIYQKPGTKESYGVQTTPPHINKVSIGLSEEESESKKDALENIYHILKNTLGQVLLSTQEPLQREVVVPAIDPLRWPAEGMVLRYHDRGEALKEAGAFKDVITYKNHFEPLVKKLKCI